MNNTNTLNPPDPILLNDIVYHDMESKVHHNKETPHPPNNIYPPEYQGHADEHSRI